MKQGLEKPIQAIAEHHRLGFSDSVSETMAM